MCFHSFLCRFFYVGYVILVTPSVQRQSALSILAGALSVCLSVCLWVDFVRTKVQGGGADIKVKVIF